MLIEIPQDDSTKALHDRLTTVLHKWEDEHHQSLQGANQLARLLMSEITPSPNLKAYRACVEALKYLIQGVNEEFDHTSLDDHLNKADKALALAESVK